MTEEKQPNEQKEDGKRSFEEITQDLMNYIKKQTGSDAIVSFQGPFKNKAELGVPPEVKSKEELRFEFNYKPKDIKAYLDKFVMKQDEAKKVLSIAICDHFNHIKNCLNSKKFCKNYHKQNVLLIGPTGVGKTYLIKCISDLIGVPFVRSDATKFTETGYVGGDVEDLVRQLVSKANQNIRLAECGIIYLDEIDKIASFTNRSGRDVGGRGVQSNLLKLMEETEVPLKTPWDINSQIKTFFQSSKEGSPETINTKHILFIVSGAFDGLDEIIEKRTCGSKFGFHNGANSLLQDKSPLLHQVSTGDLIKFGFESEFVGRLPVRVACDPLSADDLFLILKEAESSILHQYIEAFSYYGIEVHFDDGALQEIAALAYKEKTGARGLATVFERIFRDYKFVLPSTHVKAFLITKNLIKNPDGYLKKIIKQPLEFEDAYYMARFDQFEEKYYKHNQIYLIFDKDLRKSFIKTAKNDSIPISALCSEFIAKMGFGLDLLKTKFPNRRYVLTGDVLERTDYYIDKWIKEGFQK